MKHTFLTPSIYMGILALVFASCSNGTKEISKTETIDNHTVQNALDWQGTYSGNLPCADCDYIATELTLNEDLTYQLISEHLGKGKTKIDTMSGKFSWEGNHAKLAGIAPNERPSVFKIEENQVRQMDMEGNAISGDLAQNYVMKKNGNLNVEDKKWQLTELNGKTIKGSPETHYIIFHSKDSRLEAKANCNVLSNSYSIKNELVIKIEPGITTMMACPDNIEEDFKAMLMLADNLSTDGQTLTLNKARMAPLAKFVLVAN